MANLLKQKNFGPNVVYFAGVCQKVWDLNKIRQHVRQHFRTTILIKILINSLTFLPWKADGRDHVTKAD